MRTLDKYTLNLALWPMLGSLGVTLVALLLERILRLLDVLSDSSNRFGFVAELAVNLIPHYLGLTLPAGFFTALFIVVTRLNENSEIDALLASGVSLSRFAAPYICLGAALAAMSLVLFGFIQPYSRYAYRAVLHSAQNAGWNGQIRSQAFISPDETLTMTADSADTAGRRLDRIFIRKMTPRGPEITTARSAKIIPDRDGKSVILTLKDGQQLSANVRGEPEVLAFDSINVQAPLAGAAQLLRARGGDERELTLFELVREAHTGHPVIPKQTLLAELYARLARAMVLPLLPLLAVPLGLTAKRGGRAPGIIVAGLLLLAFQHAIQLGQSLAASGRADAAAGIGAPFFVFTFLCAVTFISGRKRPGQTPLGIAIEHVMHAISRLRMKRAAAHEAQNGASGA